MAGRNLMVSIRLSTNFGEPSPKSRFSERQLQAELDIPVFDRRRANAAEGGRAPDGVGVAELGRVGEVEELGAELEFGVGLAQDDGHVTDALRLARTLD